MKGALDTWCLLFQPPSSPCYDYRFPNRKRTERDQRWRERESQRKDRTAEEAEEIDMDGGDGFRSFHVAGGGDGAQQQDKTLVNNRVMLRFRPIAPKPAPGSSFPGENSATAMSNSLYAPKKRTKRKYVRTKKNTTRSSSSTTTTTTTTTVTLQLLPEEPGDFSGGRSWLQTNLSIDQTVEKQSPDLSAMQRMKGLTEKTEFLAAGGSDRTAAAESWVTVESVTSTDTCMEGGLSCTDEERVRSLEKDTCPGFVSDRYNRVVWVNEAYKNTVGPEEGVWLVAKAELPPSSATAAFSCMVRLQYTCRPKEEKCSKIVPCDAWRLKERAGWLEWRLDMKAALSLGL